MQKPAKIDIYVGLITLITIGVMAVSWPVRTDFPGALALISFVLVCFLLDQTFTMLRVGASGSTSFVMHLAAGILFGGFWGGIVAGSSTALTMGARRKGFQKTLFNAAQRTLCVSTAVLVYHQVFHGSIPPAYLKLTPGVTPEAVQHDVFLFFAFAAVYVLVNSSAVSGAVVLTTDRPFREIWHLNFRGLIAYDIVASVIAMLVAFLYVRVQAAGYGPLGIAGVVVPILVVRHIYGMYHQLQNSGQELLQVMVKAIEARDPYTSGHSLRVSEMSRTIALELGLSAREIEQVETAALLHDVGKIYEEFAPLLRKESRLTPEETALMQTHSTKSAELVGIISKFHGFIQDSVRHHHERWDGQGYPAGLANTAIPLGSRIILISDTIDAMTTDRPYRKRLPLEVVISELQKCKGTQFDPTLVDVVISSVAVRRLIVGPNADQPTDAPTRSKRVSWPAAGIWRTKRA